MKSDADDVPLEGGFYEGEGEFMSDRARYYVVSRARSDPWFGPLQEEHPVQNVPLPRQEVLKIFEALRGAEHQGPQAAFWDREDVRQAWKSAAIRVWPSRARQWFPDANANMVGNGPWAWEVQRKRQMHMEPLPPEPTSMVVKKRRMQRIWDMMRFLTNARPELLQHVRNPRLAQALRGESNPLKLEDALFRDASLADVWSGETPPEDEPPTAPGDEHGGDQGPVGAAHTNTTTAPPSPAPSSRSSSSSSSSSSPSSGSVAHAAESDRGEAQEAGEERESEGEGEGDSESESESESEGESLFPSTPPMTRRRRIERPTPGGIATRVKHRRRQAGSALRGGAIPEERVGPMQTAAFGPAADGLRFHELFRRGKSLPESSEDLPDPHEVEQVVSHIASAGLGAQSVDAVCATLLSSYPPPPCNMTLMCLYVLSHSHSVDMMTALMSTIPEHLGRMAATRWEALAAHVATYVFARILVMREFGVRAEAVGGDVLLRLERYSEDHFGAAGNLEQHE